MLYDNIFLAANFNHYFYLVLGGIIIGSVLILNIVKMVIGSMPSGGYYGSPYHQPYGGGLGSILGFIILIALGLVLFKYVIQPTFQRGSPGKTSQMSLAGILDVFDLETKEIAKEAPPTETPKELVSTSESYQSFLPTQKEVASRKAPNPMPAKIVEREQDDPPAAASFYIQLASYSTKNNLQAGKKQYHDQEGPYNLLMLVDESGWDPSYKLLLGPFDDKAKAKLYNQKKQLKGFVKEVNSKDIQFFP